MTFREATVKDIAQIQSVRNSVKENTLPNPNLVTDSDCMEYLTQRGKGWICEIDHRIVGFAIADLFEDNIWALFLHPDYERQGIGQRLHEIMLNWYFNQGKEQVWLSTSPATRAERFYKKAGWIENGFYGKEIKFTMTKENWLKIR